MAKREFLQLAHKYDPSKHKIAGWYMSEKLDGERCWWDGGVSRGVPAKQVPWANTAKDDRLLDPDYKATGLWTRGGKVIHAPAQWLDKLPRGISLDGELYTDRLGFQFMRSTVSRLVPNVTAWSQVQFYVFGFPNYNRVLATGSLSTTYYHKSINWLTCLEFINTHRKCLDLHTHPMNFENALMAFEDVLAHHPEWRDPLVLHTQRKLPDKGAYWVIQQALKQVEGLGGEGLMLRNPKTPYDCRRSYDLLKVKPRDEGVGVVIGCTTGKETDKGSRLLGHVGALLVTWEGATFEMSGLSDDERSLRALSSTQLEAETWAVNHPGQRVPEWIEAASFPRGTKVEFKYMRLTDAGIPKFAQFHRKV